MPLYEYECENCTFQFELIQKFSDAPEKECPKCKGKLKKLISSPGIMFKGTGWYVTDYSDKLKNKSGEEKKKPESKEVKGTEPAAGSTTTVSTPPVSKAGEDKKPPKP